MAAKYRKQITKQQQILIIQQSNKRQQQEKERVKENRKRKKTKKMINSTSLSIGKLHFFNDKDDDDDDFKELKFIRSNKQSTIITPVSTYKLQNNIINDNQNKSDSNFEPTATRRNSIESIESVEFDLVNEIEEQIDDYDDDADSNYKPKQDKKEEEEEKDSIVFLENDFITKTTTKNGKNDYQVDNCNSNSKNNKDNKNNDFVDKDLPPSSSIFQGNIIVTLNK